MSWKGAFTLVIRFFSCLAIAWFIGWFAGRPTEFLVAFLAAWLLWHAVHVVLLWRWLAKPGVRLPESRGFWSHAFTRIRSMEQCETERKAQRTAMIGDFRAVANELPDAILLTDPDRRLTWFNTAARVQFQLEDPGHIGKLASGVIRIPGFQQWLKGPAPERRQLKMEGKDRQDTWLEVNSVEVQDGQRLVILRDTSQVQNLERIRRDFVTNVSHELRTPLTVMLGYLEVFLNRPTDELSDPMQRMHSQAVQMQEMLDDFLELSRIQALEAGTNEKHIDVAEVLDRLREQAVEISRGDHEIDFDINRGLGLTGIETDIESAFRNLVVNALKYTEKGGKISVRWFDSPQGPTLEVRDTGVGIPSRDIPRLTERFYRVGSDRGRKTGGTGLGLAIVKNVLTAHGAQFLIESEYGVGSRFSCVFPPERSIH
jgi:two-component system phosphate regulon sensor histidine kinase PhoR